MSLMSRLARQAGERDLPVAVTIFPDEAGPAESGTYRRTFDDTDRNDIANARHFAARHKEAVRFCGPWQKWLKWDGRRWKIDDENVVFRMAGKIVEDIFRAGLACRDAEHRDVIIRWGASTANVARMRSMLFLAGTEMPIAPDAMDSDPWMLNCENGTIDLRNGSLLPHDRTQWLTKLCPTVFDPGATAPTWSKFLSEVFGDPELIGFIGRLFGYFLTGVVSEQKLPIFYGTGANGKSTLLNAFMSVVGPDYAMQGQPDFLMERKGESHPTERASLFGRRFVSCVETERSRKLAESHIKVLTGGERIMARRMREDFWEFSPTHKLALCTNHRPVVTGTDHGIWRRLLLIPFTQRFDGARQDKDLPERLAAESSGILAWAVRGCLEWQRIGLQPPDSVSVATADYRTSEDVLGRFMSECCVVSQSCSVRFSELYDRLTAWCKDGGDDLPSKKAVGGFLDESGFQRYSANGRMYRGVVLKSFSHDTEFSEQE